MLEKLRTKRDNHEGGFTLIELLIVIVILGVLAAVVIFSVGGITNKSASAACQADASTINSAAEAYYAQTGVAATNMYALVTANLLKSDATITAVGARRSRPARATPWSGSPGAATGTEGPAGGVDAGVQFTTAATGGGCLSL